MPKAPAKPGVKGKGLNGKIGPVPVKVAIFLAAGVVVYLLYRHYKGAQTTSAGSNATPSPSSTLPLPSGDSTGGGASGGIGADVPSPTPPTPGSFPPVFNFAFTNPQQATLPPSGGNTSPPNPPNSPSQPQTSFSELLVPAAQFAASFASPTLLSPVKGAPLATDITGTLAKPSSVVQIGGGKTTPTTKPKPIAGAGSTASRNKTQGVYTIH